MCSSAKSVGGGKWIGLTQFLSSDGVEGLQRSQLICVEVILVVRLSSVTSSWVVKRLLSSKFCLILIYNKYINWKSCLGWWVFLWKDLRQIIVFLIGGCQWRCLMDILCVLTWFRFSPTYMTSCIIRNIHYVFDIVIGMVLLWVRTYVYICEKILRGLIKKMNSFKLVLFHIELALRMKYSKYEMELRKKPR